MSKIILDIVPLTRIPLTSHQSFSYLSDTKVPFGSLVSIPLFHRNVEGVVLGNRPDFPRLGNIELKKISKVLTENFLDEKQFALANFISAYYLSPLGIVLKSFIPKRTKERTKKDSEKNISLESKAIILTKEQRLAIDKIDSKFKIQNLPAGRQGSKFLLYGPAGSGKTEIYLNAIKNLKSGEQALVLLPELTLTPQAIERYGAIFQPENITVINSRISKGKYYSAWQKIKSGKAKVIIGSRMAVFLPFRNLKMIVIDEEQDISFKQWDMNPRYDARTVAEKLAEIHQAKIIRGSATPSIESFYKTENKKYTLLKLPKLKIPHAQYPTPDTSIEIVDMKKERWQHLPAGRQGNYSSLSKKLRSEITYALNHELQSILFINRQGMSTFSVCDNCKTVLACPRCERALVYDNKGIYRCVHCAYVSSIMPECIKCKGIIFKNIGLGTQKVEKEAQGAFPGARIDRADNQNSKEKDFQARIYREFKEKKIDILVGTQMISKGWDLPSLSLVGIIDADNMLALPDFSVREKAFQTILQVAGRVSRPGAKYPGQVIIQTFNPNQEFFKFIATGELEKFYQAELAERRILNLPPFGKLIKLTFQDLSAAKTQTQAKDIFEILSQIISKKIVISEPQAAFIPKIRGRYRQQITIKIIGTSEIPKNLTKIIKTLSAGWIIDIDPISII